LFLLPVAIDDTRETGARVPEKFFSVQWLRAPGGEFGAALGPLVKRLLSGDHDASAFKAAVSNPPTPSAAARRDGPPPMPPFPHHPEKAVQWPRFLAEILWWVLTVVWL